MAALALLGVYLALFYLAGRLAADAAGRPVWLFSRARGKDRLAALLFRAGFVLAALAALDPLALDGPQLAGAALAGLGGMLAFAGQMAMGASWRVGVARGETGPLISQGLHRHSRNPVFLGQAVLLAGVAVALPGPLSALGLVAFVIAANLQIRSEESALASAHGPAYAAYAAGVPRWFAPRRGIRRI